MKAIKTISLSLLVCTSLSFGWEVNTHRAIDRCALGNIKGKACGRTNIAQNLHNFAEDLGLKKEDYSKEYLDGYSLANGKSPVGYFEYITDGEEFGISGWHQSFSNHSYTDLIEAGTILEDALWAGITQNVTAPLLGLADKDSGKGRFNYHFYDYQDSKNEGAGLSIVPGFANENAVNWAKDGGNGALYVPDAKIIYFPAMILPTVKKETHTNNYSYKKALEYYKQGFTEPKPEDRKKYRAKMFVSLGYMLHLLNDMNVPAHTRDDSHPLGDPLEEYMRGDTAHGFRIIGSVVSTENKKIFDTIKSVTPFKYKKSSTFEDFYKKEAEYTGTHFYSEDSISVNGGTYGGYKTYHPTKDEVDEQIDTSNLFYDDIGYVRYNSSDLVTGHTKVAMIQETNIWTGGLIGKAVKPYWYSMQYNGDESVLLDNGINLIPRAVANAEGFINYFFRGRIKANLVDGNLTIENISDSSLVADASVVKFDGGFTIYYETDSNETKPLGTHSFIVNDFEVGDKLSYDISSELASATDIGKANKITILFQGKIGTDDGVSVAIAKKFTNADLLFSFDKSGSMGSDIENAKNSAKDILDNIIGVDNNSTYIEVEAFNGSAGVLLSYENNVTKAENAINTIYSGGGTALYDAIKLAGNNAVAHKKASKIAKSIVILYTDGLENSSYASSRQQAIDAISNAKAPEIDEVFLIHVGSGDGASELKSIADEAGREYLKVNNASALKDAIEKILKGQ